MESSEQYERVTLPLSAVMLMLLLYEDDVRVGVGVTGVGVGVGVGVGGHKVFRESDDALP